MSRCYILQKIVDAVVNEHHVEESIVKESADFQADLGMDSLDTIEVVMKMEHTFGVVVPDNELNSISTVGDLLNVLIRLGV